MTAALNHIASPGAPTLCGLTPSAKVKAWDFCSIDLTPGWCPVCVAGLEETYPLTDERRQELFNVGILTLASGLWMQKTGAADGMSDREWGEIRAYLTERVMTWKTSDPEWKERHKIDGAALAYVVAVLEACEGGR